MWPHQCWVEGYINFAQPAGHTSPGVVHCMLSPICSEYIAGLWSTWHSLKFPGPFSRGITLSVASQPILMLHDPKGQNILLVLIKLHEVSLSSVLKVIEIPLDWSSASCYQPLNQVQVSFTDLLRVYARSSSKSLQKILNNRRTVACQFLDNGLLTTTEVWHEQCSWLPVAGVKNRLPSCSCCLSYKLLTAVWLFLLVQRQESFEKGDVKGVHP